MSMSIEQKNLSNHRINEIKQFTSAIQQVILNEAKTRPIYYENNFVYLDPELLYHNVRIEEEDLKNENTRYIELVGQMSQIRIYEIVQYSKSFEVIDEGLVVVVDTNPIALKFEGCYTKGDIVGSLSSGHHYILHSCYYVCGLYTGQCRIDNQTTKSSTTNWFYSGIRIPSPLIVEYIRDELLVKQCGFPRELAHMIWEILDCFIPQIFL